MTHIVAVTGATGFVGSHVIDQALAAGMAIRALTRSPQPPRERVDWVAGSLADHAALADLCSGADAVIHVAGAVNVPSREQFAQANIAGTQAVVDAARAAGVRRFVHVSSLAAREPGLSNYGWSKAEAEAVVKASSLDWVIVRPPGVYGPRDADMLELFRMARRGFMLLPPAGRGSWIFAPDLAALLVTLCSTASHGLTYEPDDGDPVSHKDLARRIGAAIGRPRPVSLSAPAWLIQAAARADRLIRGDRARLTPDRARYMTHPDWTADPAHAVPATLWGPSLSTVEGMKVTARWYREAGWIAA